MGSLAERSGCLTWRPSILAVEDDPVTARLMQAALDRLGFLHGWAEDLQEARRFLGRWPVDAIILDLGLPDGTGLELLEEVRRDQLGPRPAVLVCSGRGDEETVVSALEARADDFLLKPLDLDELSLRLRRLLRKPRLPWSSWDELLTSLGHSAPEHLQHLRKARKELDAIAQELRRSPPPQGTKDLVQRALGAADTVGAVPFRDALAGLPDPDPAATAKLVGREVARIDLILQASGGDSRRLTLPEDEEGPTVPEPSNGGARTAGAAGGV